MALTDEQIQDLQGKTKEASSNLEQGDTLTAGGQQYEVVASTGPDSVTQGISVAPIVKGKPDYSQTAIVVAGTQPPNDEKGNGLGNELNSTFRAIIQSGTGYSIQGRDVEALYQQTEANLNAHGGGEITNMSGHSQAGPAVAKVAANHNVDRVTNFSDWGGGTAYTNGYISEEDKKYLDKHAHIYSDEGNAVTMFAKDGGWIPYGDVREVDGSNHGTDHAHIKGNNLDIDYYVKHGQLCSGMTKDQVKKAARLKAKNETDVFIKEHPEVDGEKIRKDKEKAYYDSYVKNYEKDYGPYADKKSGKSKQTSSLLDSWELHALGTKVGGLATLLGAAGGGQQIFLKTEMLVALASQAMAQFAGFEAKFLAELEEAKEEVRRQCEEAKQRCLQAGPHLSSGEIEALMAPIQFEHVWDSGAEADIRAMLQSLKSQMTEISTHLVTSAERFSASDNTAAVQFM